MTDLKARLPAAVRGLLEFVFSGFLVGVVTGIVDAWLAHRLFAEVLSFNAVIDAAVIYSTLWALVGIVIFSGLSLWHFCRHRLFQDISLRYRPVLLFSCLSFFLLGCTIINRKYLPVAHSAKSLGFDLAWLLLWVAVYGFVRRRGGADKIGGRRLLILGLACIIILFTIVLAGRKAGLPEVGENVPNIILLVIDDVRADHLHCYGYGRPISPHIDALSREGVLFSSAYAAAPWTLPSVVSLLTSRYPSEHGTNDLRFKLSGEVPTLLDALKEYGYQVGIFSNSPWISIRYGIGREADYFDRPYLSIHYALYFLDKYSPFRLDNRVTGRFLFSDRGLTARFLNWSEAVINNQGKVFAYLHLMGPHVPYVAPVEYRKRLGLGSVPRLNPPGYGGLISFEDQPSLPAGDLKELVGNYDAALMYGDEVVGLLRAGLKKMGAYDNTVIIFTSDHGEEFYDHRGWYHGDSLFEEQIRIPLIMAWPGHFPPGLRIDDQLSQTDLMPMILYLAEQASLRPIGIQDLVAAGRDSRRLGRDLIYSEVIYKNRGGRMVREGKYKLICGFNEDGKEVFLLFDLEADPGELKNIIQDEPEIASRLYAELQRFHSQLLENRSEIEEAGVDHLMNRRLRALGYLR